MKSPTLTLILALHTVTLTRWELNPGYERAAVSLLDATLPPAARGNPNPNPNPNPSPSPIPNPIPNPNPNPEPPTRWACIAPRARP